MSSNSNHALANGKIFVILWLKNIPLCIYVYRYTQWTSAVQLGKGEGDAAKAILLAHPPVDHSLDRYIQEARHYW